VSLIRPLAAPVDGIGRREGLLVVTPIALLAGWLTIATALNAITVLTAEGFVRAGAALWWAIGGVTAVVAVTLVVFIRSRVVAYPLPVVWGLIAVFVAERSDSPAVAWYALLAAALTTAVVVARRRRPW
jgi:hypothetical protein